MQYAMQRRMPLLLLLRSLAALRRILRSSWRRATIRLPKQMLPRLYVLERMKESRTAIEQKDDASRGVNHQVPENIYRKMNKMVRTTRIE